MPLTNYIRKSRGLWWAYGMGVFSVYNLDEVVKAALLLALSLYLLPIVGGLSPPRAAPCNSSTRQAISTSGRGLLDTLRSLGPSFMDAEDTVFMD